MILVKFQFFLISYKFLVLSIFANYRACENPKKVNLSVGAYRDDEGLPVVLGSVRKSEQ